MLVGQYEQNNNKRSWLKYGEMDLSGDDDRKVKNGFDLNKKRADTPCL